MRWGQWQGEYSWARVEKTACVGLLRVGKGADYPALVRTTAALCTINKKICIRTFTLREERGICIIKCGLVFLVFVSWEMVLTSATPVDIMGTQGSTGAYFVDQKPWKLPRNIRDMYRDGTIYPLFHCTLNSYCY